jgi:hypothetical protein
LIVSTGYIAKCSTTPATDPIYHFELLLSLWSRKEFNFTGYNVFLERHRITWRFPFHKGVIFWKFFLSFLHFINTNTSYSIYSLIDFINNYFNSNEILYGSNIDIYNIGSDEYIKITKSTFVFCTKNKESE